MKPEIYKNEGYQFMAAAFEVYSNRGYGLAEDIYQERLEIELEPRGIHQSRLRASHQQSLHAGLAFMSAD